MKRILAASVMLALAGCGGSDGGSPSVGSDPLTHMTPIEKDYQTFGDVTKYQSAGSSSTNGYAFFHSDSNDFIEIEFGHKEDEQSPSFDSIISPRLTRIIEINSDYAAVNIQNVLVRAYGKSYQRGELTLIQHKESGKLYPLFDNGQPVYIHVDATLESWIGSDYFSNVADESRLYLRYGEEKSLHVAELNQVDGAFEISKVFDDYFREYWVLENGDVISKPWSDIQGNTLLWIEKATGTTHTFFVDFENRYSAPFIHNNQLLVLNYPNGTVDAVTLNDGALSITDSGWEVADGSSYHPAINNHSVRRGSFEVQSNCAVYKFDDANKTITEISLAKAHSNGAVVGGQNSIFCLHGFDDNLSGKPTFSRFDLSNPNNVLEQEVTATLGTNIDAGERLSIISDKEVMFTEYPFGRFEEFMVNFDSGDTTSRSVSELSVIKLQRMKIQVQ